MKCRYGHGRMTLMVAAQLLVALPTAGSALATASGEADKVKILVTGITAQPQDAALADSLISVLADEITALGMFKVYTMTEIEEMLGVEAQKQALGCDSSSCFAELGGALGAALAVRGSLSRSDTAFMLNLQLINVNGAQVQARVNRDSPLDTRRLIEGARAAARILMRDTLKQHAGRLLVEVSEEGSSVYIDDRLVGSSPLSILEVAGGTHTLRIEREGFVAWSRDVDVVQDDVTKIRADLLPSAEYIRSYEASAGRTRLLGWGGTIGGGVSLVAAAVLYGMGGRWASERDALFDKYRSVAGGIGFEQRRALWDEGNDLNDRVIFADRAAAIGFFAGAILAGVGSYLLTSGDDPERYRQFNTSISAGDAGQAQLQLRWWPGAGAQGFVVALHY